MIRKVIRYYKTEKYRFEIINAVTDESKGTILSVISLVIPAG